MKKMDKDVIYVPLQGRIGNQLFQYAIARRIQIEKGKNAKIIMDDSDVLRCKWENSLAYYNLPNVEYVHDSITKKTFVFSHQAILRNIYKVLTKYMNYKSKFAFEKKIQFFINKLGVALCENGYIDFDLDYSKPIYLEGYFQSEKYFKNYYFDIKNIITDNFHDQLNEYPEIDKIRRRNTVCISVKIEHNVGNSIFSVCGIDYWKKAIEYIMKNVENPLFFICSDNVSYVLDNLIDTNKYDYVVQDKNSPVFLSLAAMAECKHFIIGNTTFGWWAQYLSEFENKMVIAPSKWMAIDMPVDIYQNNWILIEV